MYSKKEKMKRKLADLVDSLHNKEINDLNSDMNEVTPEIKKWQTLCTEPVLLDVFVANKIKKKTFEAKKAKEDKEKIDECNHFKIRNDKLNEVSKICKLYGMQDYTVDKIQPSDRDLVSPFAYGIANPIGAYKKSGSM